MGLRWLWERLRIPLLRKVQAPCGSESGQAVAHLLAVVALTPAVFGRWPSTVMPVGLESLDAGVGRLVAHSSRSTGSRSRATTHAVMQVMVLVVNGFVPTRCVADWSCLRVLHRRSRRPRVSPRYAPVSQTDDMLVLAIALFRWEKDPPRLKRLSGLTLSSSCYAMAWATQTSCASLRKIGTSALGKPRTTSLKLVSS